MADGFAVRVENDRIAPTIADDRAMTSIQDESLSLVLGDKLFNWLTYFGRPAPASWALHGHLLFGYWDSNNEDGYVVGNDSGKPYPD